MFGVNNLGTIIKGAIIRGVILLGGNYSPGRFSKGQFSLAATVGRAIFLVENCPKTPDIIYKNRLYVDMEKNQSRFPNTIYTPEYPEYKRKCFKSNATFFEWALKRHFNLPFD